MDIQITECTDEVRNRIWDSKFDVRGSLYLLHLEKEKALQRSAKEQKEYGHRLRSEGFFKPEDVEHTHKDLLILTINPKLKPALYPWMEKFTSKEEYSSSVSCFAMLIMLYLKDQIVKEEFHTSKKKKYGAVIKSFNQLFHGSPFENVLDVMLGILQVRNQGINAKTNEKKTRKEVAIDGTINSSVKQTVGKQGSNFGETQKGEEVCSIIDATYHVKHTVAKQDNNVNDTQKEMDVKTGVESTNEDDPKREMKANDKSTTEIGAENETSNDNPGFLQLCFSVTSTPVVTVIYNAW
jgi:hypothetical protein